MIYRYHFEWNGDFYSLPSLIGMNATDTIVGHRIVNPAWQKLASEVACDDRICNDFNCWVVREVYERLDKERGSGHGVYNILLGLTKSDFLGDLLSYEADLRARVDAENAAYEAEQAAKPGLGTQLVDRFKKLWESDED